LDDKARDLIRRANEAAQMGARLSGRLLAIGRRQRLQPINLDLNEITRSMTDVLKRTLGDMIEIQANLPDDLWPALADISEVENAILNLAINARDAMPSGGKLIIATTNKSLGPDDVVGEAGLLPGDYVMLSISDTGVGIPPHLIARVFEPFFTTKESGRGTGLGLSTIYGFAKQSGGHLAIYSEVGKGTSVRLYLPRAANAAAAAGDTPLAMPEKAVDGEIVLVVEDNADVREVTVKRLDTLGYRVVTAENGPAALEILKSPQKVDLLFSDVMMPGGMSGFDLVRWVRTNKPAIKTLLTSGFTGEVAKNGNSDLDDVEVLRKPYAIAELAQAVREALN
jgi:CheY-like chemotaxis protein